MRKFVLISSAAFCLSAASPPDILPFDLDHLEPNVPDVAAAAARARAARCEAPACRAVILLDKLDRIENYLLGDLSKLPGGHMDMRRYPTEGDPDVAERRIEHVLLQHPELFGPFCALGVTLIARLPPEAHEYEVSMQLLTQAMEIDIRDHRHCTRDMLDALPHTRIATDLRISAGDSCVGLRYSRHQPFSWCDILTQNLSPPARP